jgi:seryl-tRNA synthetase
MHDIRLIRENPESFDAALARRGLEPLAAGLIALDEERRALTTQVQVAQSRRNEASKLIGAAMAKGDKDAAEALKAEVAALKDARRRRRAGSEAQGSARDHPKPARRRCAAWRRRGGECRVKPLGHPAGVRLHR